MRPSLPAGATRLFAAAFVAALLGAVLAVAAQLLQLGVPGLAANASDLELVRDVLLSVVLPAACLAALGRMATDGAPGSEVLARVERLAAALAASGGVVVLAAAGFSGERLRLVLAGGVALVALAVLIDSMGLLGRTARAGELFGASVRVAVTAGVVAMPMALIALVLLVSERVAHVELWRGVSDAASLERGLRDIFAAFVPLALLAGSGAVLDGLAAVAARPWIAPESTRAALWALPMFGVVGFGARVFGGVGASALVAQSLMSLLCVVPAAVLVGNALATLAFGRLERAAVRPAALAAMVLLVERAAVAVPTVLAALRGELSHSGLDAAGDELGWAAMGFLVVVVASERLGERATGPGVIAFCGVQLALVARLAAATAPRGLGGLPAVLRSERVAVVGVSLIIAAAVALIGALLGALRAARARPAPPA